MWLPLWRGSLTTGLSSHLTKFFRPGRPHLSYEVPRQSRHVLCMLSLSPIRTWNRSPGGQAAPALLASWRDYVALHKDSLALIRVGDIDSLDVLTFARGALQRPGRLYHPNQLKAMGAHILAVALALTLSRAGWEFLYAGPGSPLAFRNGGRVLEPFRLLSDLFNGSTTGADWRTCARQMESVTCS
jgi:hypothetical protein